MPLHRSRQHKMIAGVCGGIAEWLGWDPTVVRILYIIVSVLSAAFPGIIVYVVLWVLMPKAPALSERPPGGAGGMVFSAMPWMRVPVTTATAESHARG